MKRYAIAVISVLVLASVWASAETQKKDVDIKAPDGANLKGTYFSPEHPGPAILLLHQCNMDRHAWDGFASDLASAGFHVLTVNYRGYGDSAESTTDAAARRALQPKWPADIDAMFAYLLAQKGVDKSRVAVGGASCGVAQSTNLAVRHHEIKVLIELSGPATDEARAYVAQTPSLAIFGAVSQGDTDYVQGIRDLLAASKNPQSQLHLYPGIEHGAPMFAKNAELEPLIVSWLKTQLMARATGSN
jgi:dienelactone hydrolase